MNVCAFVYECMNVRVCAFDGERESKCLKESKIEK